MNSNVDPPVITSIQYTESLIVLFVVLRVDQFKLHVCSMSLLYIAFLQLVLNQAIILW